jgi:hypothetical protein
MFIWAIVVVSSIVAAFLFSYTFCVLPAKRQYHIARARCKLSEGMLSLSEAPMLSGEIKQGTLSFPIYPGQICAELPEHEYGLPHVGLPRSAFRDSEGELKSYQLAQHRVQTSRLLCNTKICKVLQADNPVS